MKGMNAIVEKWATFESNNKKLYTKKKKAVFLLLTLNDIFKDLTIGYQDPERRKGQRNQRGASKKNDKQKKNCKI